MLGLDEGLSETESHGIMANMTEEQFAALPKVRGGVVGTASPSKGGRRRDECNRALISAVGSNPTPAPFYKSKWDEAYGYVLMLEKQTGLIRDYGYETMTLKLAQGKYHRPDYTVWHLDGTIELRQIKGYHKNLRASLTALIWAAQKHPWYRFTLWRRKGQGWEMEEVAS